MIAGSLDADHRERFIPIRKTDIVEALAAEARLAEPDAGAAFRQFCRLLGSIFHYEHFEELERLKDAYFHFNPHQPGDPSATGAAEYGGFVERLRRVLLRANFIEVTEEEIARACHEQALFSVEVRTALDDYRDLRFFRRGRHREEVERREWMGFRVRKIPIEVYDDVVMVVAMKDAQPVASARRKDKRRRRTHRPGSVLIKCFRDIPSADLNTLLPDVRVVMGWRDRWLLGVPALFAGIPLLLKLGPTLAILAILIGVQIGNSGTIDSDRLKQALVVTSGLLALGGFIGHLWLKYQRQTLRYQLDIHGNIYFRNVNNNAGIFDAIIGAAEEQELKEALLAYFFLLGDPMDIDRLDRRIEGWLAARFGVSLDFEVDDGVAKLERLGLVEDIGGRLSVPPIGEALRRLDQRWDGFFTFNNPGPTTAEETRLAS